MINKSELEELIQHGDEPLDNLVKRWAHEASGVETIAALFKAVHLCERLELTILEDMLSKGLINQSILDFFVNHSTLPDLPWIEHDQIVRGGEFFRQRGLLTFVGLAFASLPACYCWDTEARVLTTTGRLSQPGRIPRRIPETAQFVLDIGTQAAFEPNGVGIQAAHKIRLMHACIRFLLDRDPATVSVDPNKRYLKPWDNQRFGPPISQAYMAATLLTFHQVILTSLRRLSVQVNSEQELAYIHRWNVAGYFLGITPEVLQQISTAEEANALHKLVMNEWRHKTVSGQDLSTTLIEYVRNNIIEGATGGIWNPLVVVPPVLTRYLSGKETAKSLGLRLNLLQKLAYLPVVFFTRIVGFLDNFRIFKWVTTGLTRYATRHLWHFTKEQQGLAPEAGERPAAQGVVVPTEFCDLWGIEVRTPTAAGN